MRKALLFIVLGLILILATGTAFAGPPAPEGVNNFDVSPDPAAPGDTVTININVNITAGADNTSSFCLYAPATAGANFPASITLTYWVGLTPTNATFTGSAGSCPAISGTVNSLYTATGLPAGDTTFGGSATFTISAAATPGTYTWRIVLEEPSTTPTSMNVSHTIESPTAVTLLGTETSTAATPLVLLAALLVLSAATLLLLRRRPLRV
jgi:hypothetical protein